MTESSMFWTTNDTGDGPATGYTQTQMFQFLAALTVGITGVNRGGVLPDWLNELEVTEGSGNVQIDTGAAMVYGIPYFNSAAEVIAVSTPVTSTRVDRIVLEADWAAQTVRMAKLTGSEGGGAPSLTQNAGTTWEIPLAEISINTGGVMTITDQREFAMMVADGSITNEKIAEGTIENDKLAAPPETNNEYIYVTGGFTNITASETVLPLTLNLQENDPNTIYSLASNVVTVAETGIYKVTILGNCSRNSGSSAARAGFYVTKNGVAQGGLTFQWYSGTVAQNPWVMGTLLLSVTAGQTVGVSAANQDTIVSLQAAGYLLIEKI